MSNLLDRIDPSELGKRLQAARKKSGFTQEQAAQAINVVRTTMVAIERGERRVRPEELAKLAIAYGQQVADLLRFSLHAETFSVPQFRGPEEYENAEAQEQIETWIEHLKELANDYYDLEQMLHVDSVTRYPEEYSLDADDVNQLAASLAAEERHRLHLGDGPIPILRDLLENEVGLRIYYLPLEPSHYSEVYLFSERIGGCIALNSQHPEERNRMSLAHAYGHFLTSRKKAIAHVEGYFPARRLKSEVFADSFAPYFLMPGSGLTRRFQQRKREQQGKITAADLVSLANYYGVSFEALIYRLEELELVPTGLKDKLQQGGVRVRDVQRQLNLSVIPARRERIPIRHQTLAIQALNEGLINEHRLASLLEIEPEAVEQFYDDLEPLEDASTLSPNHSDDV